MWILIYALMYYAGGGVTTHSVEFRNKEACFAAAAAVANDTSKRKDTSVKLLVCAKKGD